jgi:hypothetical protein
VLSGKGQIVYPKPVSRRLDLNQLDSTNPHWVVVLLLAGNYARLASGAVFILNQQALSWHLDFLFSLGFDF